MPSAIFYKYFAFISIGTAVLLLGLSQLSILQPYRLFALVSLALFMLLTWAMYLLGNKTAKSNNKGLFTSMVLGFTFGKIFLSLLIVIGYQYTANPTSKLFVLPFFIVYLIFTIFETYLMMQLGKQQAPIRNKG